MATVKTKPKSITIPGMQPLPDPVTARPVTVPTKKSSKKKPAKAAITKTEVAVIIDKSGSMVTKAADVIGGFNQYLQDLKKGDQAESMTMSVTLFDTTVKKLYRSTSLKDIQKLSNNTYKPGGNTSLLDAIGQTLSDLGTAAEDSRVLVVIMTDGQENSSREYQRDTVKQMIKEREAKGNWTFVFMGADIDAFGEAAGIGIAAANTLSHQGTNYRGAMKGLSVRTMCYTSSTLANSTDFFGGNDQKP